MSEFERVIGNTDTKIYVLQPGDEGKRIGYHTIWHQDGKHEEIGFVVYKEEKREVSEELEDEKQPMTLLELIEDAQYQIRTFRHPQIDEFEEKMSEILMAGERGSLKYDKVVSIDIHNDELVINTTYSVRCCEQTGEYKIPMKVIKSADPIYEMKLYSLNKAVKSADLETSRCIANLKRAEENSAKAQAALIDFMSRNKK
ncbi:hypothetical protein PP935_gp005 [Rhizobium phage RHph_N34]|uniref:Uncharacterized protein n=1 Tax=Rhizobium phage RHph_N34 TaxID=2509586 RepID=A0A7S5RF87_9CAUD|nr:hypothetical protein PP935_gp005 [Rhizobium phage RHph_N34]QIG73780.1 hypothetical protein EVC06_005 [Rhizobium phage RHph_N34]